MNILWAILVGVAFNLLYGILTKRRDPGSIVVRALIGMFGGAIAGVTAVAITPGADARLWISGVGVIVLLFIYSLIVDKRKTT
jgi:uncharacterized membrane protein YeaQ/YmgE (transglycosylase-associated protein family)